MKIASTMMNFFLISSLALGSTLRAEEVDLPNILKPSILEEGVQRELSAGQIAELLPWAKNSKMTLADLLENTQGLTFTDKVDRLTDGIKQTIGESAPKNSELLMRYVLNRALILNTLLDKEMSVEEVGTIDAKVRVLTLSIRMALKYSDIDVAKLDNQSSITPFAAFGTEYFNFLNDLNKSIFDASAKYTIQKTSLEWLQWDLYRDLNNTTYAAQIYKINFALKSFPSTRLTDAQSISYIRQLRKISVGLNILVKDTNPTEVVVEKPIQEVPQVKKDNFSFYNGYCRSVSSTGQFMSIVPNSNCDSGKFQYYNGYCRTISTTNNFMDIVANKNCFSGNYQYYNGYCRTISTTNNFMDIVTNNNCFSGKYQYYNGYCRSISTTNNFMDIVSNDKCQ